MISAIILLLIFLFLWLGFKPAQAPQEEPLPTPIVEIPAETNICEAISRSQLHLGMQVTISRKVNLRTSPGLFFNWIAVNQPGTQVQIIAGVNLHTL